MTGARSGAWLVAALLLLPTVAFAGRIFQWTDDKGRVHVTDNLWDVPEEPRQRYLDIVEEEARTKLTPQQIRDMKEAGNWPPLAFIRPPALKSDTPLTEWMGFRIVASDLEAHNALAQEFRFQWESYWKEEKEARQALMGSQAAIPPLEEAVEKARFDDMVMGRTADNATVPEAEKKLEEGRKALTAAQQRVSSLADKHRQLLLGKRAFRRAGEDGGPATVGLPR